MPILDKKISRDTYLRAEALRYKLFNSGKRRYFFKFLGLHEVNLDDEMSSDKAAAKILMLASPHYKTLMKVFIIKTGYKV